MPDTPQETDVVEPMRLLSDDVEIKVWCCTEALSAHIEHGTAMSGGDLRTLRNGFDAALGEITRLRLELLRHALRNPSPED